MAARIEKSFLDRLINGKLLGKRNLGLAVKYNFDNPRQRLDGRFHDILVFPKNKFERFIGNTFERFLPGFEFFCYNEEIKWARELGYTLGEKLHHGWRHTHPVVMHGLGQMANPFGFMETQRRDQFIRKIAVLMPGIEAPDWAQECKRVTDWDVNSILIPMEIDRQIKREATPAPHNGVSDFNALQNLFNHFFNFGIYAQRLFYNEELTGDYRRTGKLTNSDREQIFGWYADAQRDSQRDRINALTEEERVDHFKQVERWNKNFTKHFPEYFRQRKHFQVLHKYEEPYYERNMGNIRTSIFTQKWQEAIDKKVFEDEEIRQIYEFFLGGSTEVFFTRQNADDEYQPTPIYTKFIKELDFPDFFSIDRFTSYTPEHQFYDKLDEKWGIDFDTVDAYKRLYLQMIKNNKNSELNAFILEEIYNPVFRQILIHEVSQNSSQAELQPIEKSLSSSQTESYTIKAYEKGISLEDLKALAIKAQENATLTSQKSLDDMINSQVRTVVKSFHFKQQFNDL
jgi:hypothetical protein